MHEICNAILPGDLVIDVGANLGDKVAIYLAKGARVIAVEPQPAMIAHLTQRFGDHPDVTILPMGVSDTPGRLIMSINRDVPAISTFSNTWKDGRFRDLVWDDQAEVEITTLDAIITAHGAPRFIKIDVEGFERQVVQGLSRRHGPLSVEYTAEFLEETFGVVDLLTERGFTRFNYSRGDNDHLEFQEWIDAASIKSVLHAYAAEYGLAFGDIYCS